MLLGCSYGRVVISVKVNVVAFMIMVMVLSGGVDVVVLAMMFGAMERYV